MVLNINFDGPEYDEKEKAANQKAIDTVVKPPLRKKKITSYFDSGEPPG